MSTIVYAPRNKPVQGDKVLCVISMKWKDQNRCVSQSQANTLGNNIKNFYFNNSRKLLNYHVTAFLENVPYNAAKKNLKHAEAYVMKLHPHADAYVLINNGLQNVDNSGSTIAHVSGTLVHTACHEMGHVNGLGHAGMYTYKNGKWSFWQYGDHQSVMSAFSSNLLTAPQYYYQGWLFTNECALHDYTGPVQQYTVRRIGSLGDTSHLAAVMIKIPNQRDAFVSFPRYSATSKVIALHLTNGGGSQLVAIFGDEYKDTRFTNLDIKVISYDKTNDLITFSVEYIPNNTITNDDIPEDSTDFVQSMYDDSDDLPNTFDGEFVPDVDEYEPFEDADGN